MATILVELCWWASILCALFECIIALHCIAEVSKTPSFPIGSIRPSGVCALGPWESMVPVTCRGVIDGSERADPSRIGERVRITGVRFRSRGGWWISRFAVGSVPTTPACLPASDDKGGTDSTAVFSTNEIVLVQLSHESSGTFASTYAACLPPPPPNPQRCAGPRPARGC